LKTIVNSLLACCMFLMFFPAQSQDKIQQDIMKRAASLFEKGAYLEALPDFRQLLSSSPEDPSLNFYYGACLIASDEDPSSAVKHLRFASKTSNVDPRVNYFLGQALHMDYRFSEAEKAYLKFLETADSKVKASYPGCDRLIIMAQNGKGLLSNIKDIKVISKTESTSKDFFRNYDLSNVGGSIITVPDELLSSEDKKRGHRPLTHFDPKRPMVYFSSYGKGSDLNIYSALKGSRGSFSNPIEVPGDINTPYDEDYPFMHADGRTLYFSSKGHTSMGGYDIFSSSIEASSGLFRNVQNLDFAISSAEDDIFYIVDKDRIWANFASSRNSESGRLHVYQVKVSESPLELALVSGKVSNEAGGMSAARIKVVDAKTEKTIGLYKTDANGEYLIDLPGMGKYTFYVEVTGSDLTHIGTVDVPSFGEIRAFKQEMSLVEVGGQEKLLIKNHFDEAVEGDVMELAQEILKRKADLDVNADADELLAAQDNTKTVLSEEELLMRSGFRKEVGMDSVMALAYGQSEQVDMNRKAEESERSIAAALADKESDIAQRRAAEAETVFSAYKSSTDQAQREELMVKAASLLSGSEQHSRKAEEALYLMSQLDESIANKTATLLELNARNEALETKIMAADNESVIALMSEVKAADDQGVTQLNVLDIATDMAQKERKESERTLKRMEEIQDARDRTQSSLKTKKGVIEKTSKNKDKEILNAEIQALDAELTDYNTQLEKASVRLKTIQDQSDISAGALTLLERMRVGREEDEIASLTPLIRNQVDTEVLDQRIQNASETNNNITITRDELAEVLQKRPDLLRTYANPEMIQSYELSESIIANIEPLAQSTAQSNTKEEVNLPNQSKTSLPEPIKDSFNSKTYLSGKSPDFEAKKEALDLSENGDLADWKEALSMNRFLETDILKEIQTLEKDSAPKTKQRRIGLEDLYQKLSQESALMESQIHANESALAMSEKTAKTSKSHKNENKSTPEISEVKVNETVEPEMEFNEELQGMDEASYNIWMDNASTAGIEEISRSNALLLDQGAPESLQTSTGLASRMEKHSSYIQMVETLADVKYKSMANNPAAASKIKREIAAMDKVIALKFSVMAHELADWERIGRTSLNDSERKMALNDPRYLKERERINNSAFTPDEKVAQLEQLNASIAEAKARAEVSPRNFHSVTAENTAPEKRTAAPDQLTLTTAQKNAGIAEQKIESRTLNTVNPMQAKTLAKVDEMRDQEQDMYPLESFLTDSQWAEELIQNPAARLEAKNSLPLIQEYMDSRKNMNSQELRYAENVISMTMASPNSMEYKARGERLKNVNDQSTELKIRAEELFATADVLRAEATNESDLDKGNQNLREALLLELKSLDLLNHAESYEIHLVEGGSPENFIYTDAIEWNQPGREEISTEPTESIAMSALSTKKTSPEVMKTAPAADQVSEQRTSENVQELPKAEAKPSAPSRTPDQVLIETVQSELSETTQSMEEGANNNIKKSVLGNTAVTADTSVNSKVKEADQVVQKSEESLNTDHAMTQNSNEVSTATKKQANPTENARPSETDDAIPMIRTQEDLMKLPVLNSALAMSTLPQASAALQTENITASPSIDEGISSQTAAAVTTVELEPEMEQRLSETELASMKSIRLELLNADQYEKLLKEQDLVYKEALRKRQVRMAEVIDVQAEQRTSLQQEELQRTVAETQVLKSYLSANKENMAALEMKRVELQKAEDEIVMNMAKDDLAENLPSQTVTLSKPVSTENVPVKGSETQTLSENKVSKPTLKANTIVLPPVSSTAVPTPTVAIPAVKTSSSLGQDWKMPEVLKENIFDMATAPKKALNKTQASPAQVNTLPNGLVYQVQVGAFRNAIPNDEFSEFSPVMTEPLSSGITRYTVGLFTSEKVAVGARDQVRKLGYEDAFVVAYRNGKRVSLAEAGRALPVAGDPVLTNIVNQNIGNVQKPNSASENPAVSSNTQTDQLGNSVSQQTIAEQAKANKAADTNGSVALNQGQSQAQNQKQTPAQSAEPKKELSAAETESVSAYYDLVKDAAPANQVEMIQGLFYTVQVGVYSKPVTSTAIFDLSPLNSELMENGQIKYTSGIFDKVDVALQWRDLVVQKGVGDAFVTAYLNGKRITIASAQKILDEGGAIMTVNLDQLSELERDREGQAVWEMVSTSELFGEELKENVIFKIRMGPYGERIPDKDVRVILDFEDNVEYDRKEDGSIIYTTKGIMSYEQAQEWRKTFLERGITNANIIAFKDGKEIPVKQALDFLLK